MISLATSAYYYNKENEFGLSPNIWWKINKALKKYKPYNQIRKKYFWPIMISLVFGIIAVISCLLLMPVFVLGHFFETVWGITIRQYWNESGEVVYRSVFSSMMWDYDDNLQLTHIGPTIALYILPMVVLICFLISFIFKYILISKYSKETFFYNSEVEYVKTFKKYKDNIYFNCNIFKSLYFWIDLACLVLYVGGMIFMFIVGFQKIEFDGSGNLIELTWTESTTRRPLTGELQGYELETINYTFKPSVLMLITWIVSFISGFALAFNSLYARQKIVLPMISGIYLKLKDPAFIETLDIDQDTKKQIFLALMMSETPINQTILKDVQQEMPSEDNSVIDDN